MKNEIKRLIGKREAAGLLGISTRTFDRLLAWSERLQKARVQLRTSVRFRHDLIMKIVEEGLS